MARSERRRRKKSIGFPALSGFGKEKLFAQESTSASLRRLMSVAHRKRGKTVFARISSDRREIEI